MLIGTKQNLNNGKILIKAGCKHLLYFKLEIFNIALSDVLSLIPPEWTQYFISFMIRIQKFLYKKYRIGQLLTDELEIKCVESKNQIISTNEWHLGENSTFPGNKFLEISILILNYIIP